MNVVMNMGKVLFHPFDFFYDIQFDRRSRWSHALILMALVVVARMLSIMLVAFAYETKEPFTISYLREGTYLLLPWITWCVANWGVSAILDGEGKFKDIVVSAAYCMTPYVLLIVPLTLLTNILSLDEKSTYLTLFWFIMLWCGYLFLIKVKVLHDFELGKMFWICFLTIIGMAVIWFVGILIFGLVNQAIQFVLNVWTEISFRL